MKTLPPLPVMYPTIVRSVLKCGSAAPLLKSSKAWRNLVVFVCLFTAALSSHAQSFSIDWFTIDGGGGTSTGGVFAVSGTIGQPDAGPTLNGGSYSVVGGFWNVLAAVQPPGAPLLAINFTATNSVVVSWPSPSIGFVLQQNTDLNPTNWVGPSETLNDNGTRKFIIVNLPTSNRFYRLFKP